MVTTGEPDLVQDAPIAVHQSRRLFTSDAPQAHYSASLAQLSSGRLVLVYSWSPGIQRRNNGVLLTSRSDDDGANWTTPEAIYAQPGWDCMHLGGLMRFSDTRLLLGLGRIQMDASLPGGRTLHRLVSQHDLLGGRRRNLGAGRAGGAAVSQMVGALRGQQSASVG